MKKGNFLFIEKAGRPFLLRRGYNKTGKYYAKNNDHNTAAYGLNVHFQLILNTQLKYIP
jgi:hypothetical protein